MKNIIILTLLCLSFSYPEFNEQQEIFAHYEAQSFTPLLHIYFDRHFKNSKQFTDFEVVLNDLNEDIQDYAEIIFTDCDKNKDGKLNSCNYMKKTKDNRNIQGAYPSTDFKTIGNLVIQSPPRTRQFNHDFDVYNKEELLSFVYGLLPNFYKEIHNEEEYEQFLKPHYVPKVLLFNRDDEDIPRAMKKISVHFHLKFDFAFIGDLTDDLIPKVFDIKKFPQAMLIYYDFETRQNVFKTFEGLLTDSSYYKIKSFFEPYALKQKRNDLVFHKIEMETNTDIKYAETQGEYQRILEKANGWMLIERSTNLNSQKLSQFQKKYDRFFQYVHYKTEPNAENKISLYNPGLVREFPVEDQNLQFSTLSFSDIQSNITIWLQKDFVIMVMRQQYSHFCTIAEKNAFRTRSRCLILKEEAYPELSQFMKIQFEIGFALYTLYDEDQNKKIPKGSALKQNNYEYIYKSLEYATKVKLREVLYEFLKNPISEVKQNQITLADACFHPTKQCFFLFTDVSKKDRTLQAYVKEIALNFIESHLFFEVDISSNADLVNQFGIKQKNDLVVYNPRSREFTRLGKKVTKGLIEKLLKATRKNDKRLKKEKISNEQIKIIKYQNKQKDNEDL